MADVTSMVDEWVGAWTRAAQAGRDVAAASALATQRQWQTGLDIAAEAVDKMFSDETMTKARTSELSAGLREAGHRSVDLALDVAALYVSTMSQAIEAMAKQFPTPRNVTKRSSKPKQTK